MDSDAELGARLDRLRQVVRPDAVMERRDGECDLWIDSRVWRVPAPVWAHAQFLHDLAERLADGRVSEAQARAKLALIAKDSFDGAPTLPESGRWTAHMKRRIVLAIAMGVIERAIALDLYDLTEAELDGWERGFVERGMAGLVAGGGAE